MIVYDPGFRTVHKHLETKRKNLIRELSPSIHGPD